MALDDNFRRELATLINRYPSVNTPGTPCHILTDHLMSCLETFNNTVMAGAHWYGSDQEVKAAHEGTGHRAVDQFIRDAVNAAAPLQVGGEFYKRANLPLGGSTVVDGMEWALAEIKRLDKVVEDYSKTISDYQEMGRVTKEFLDVFTRPK